MSTVMRPSGPLPPRVYWMRRLVLVGVVVLVAGALWWVLSGVGDAPQTSSAPKQGTSGIGTKKSLPTHHVQPAVTQGADGRARARHHERPSPPASHHPYSHRQRHRHREPLAKPTGPCAPGEVAISVAVADTTTGHPATARLSLTSLTTPACTLAITPESLVLRITTTTDVVWSSADCPDFVPARRVVVRADQVTTYEFSWNGRRSVPGCTAAASVAAPGDYRLEAALVGADVHSGSFAVRG